VNARFPILLHSAFYAALRRLPPERRSRFRRLADRLAAGQWGGGARVKKLRGVAKPVFEARQDGGDRVLFTEPDGEAAYAGHRARKASARAVEGAQEAEKTPPPADVEQLIAVVHRAPGARSEDLARLTGIQGPRLAALLRAAVAAGGVTKSGATRGTRYWPPKSG